MKQDSTIGQTTQSLVLHYEARFLEFIKQRKV